MTYNKRLKGRLPSRDILSSQVLIRSFSIISNTTLVLTLDESIFVPIPAVAKPLPRVDDNYGVQYIISSMYSRVQTRQPTCRSLSEVNGVEDTELGV